jgi:hypothetical protein
MEKHSCTHSRHPPWESDPDSDPAAAAAEHNNLGQADDSADLSSGSDRTADASSHWLPQDCDASASCLRYHVQEFLSALLVLLRLAPLRREELLEAAALQELHYSVLQVNKSASSTRLLMTSKMGGGCAARFAELH